MFHRRSLCISMAIVAQIVGHASSHRENLTLDSRSIASIRQKAMQFRDFNGSQIAMQNAANIHEDLIAEYQKGLASGMWFGYSQIFQETGR